MSQRGRFPLTHFFCPWSACPGPRNAALVVLPLVRLPGSRAMRRLLQFLDKYEMINENSGLKNIVNTIWRKI
jgi:hypothetical protein